VLVVITAAVFLLVQMGNADGIGDCQPAAMLLKQLSEIIGIFKAGPDVPLVEQHIVFPDDAARRRNHPHFDNAGIQVDVVGAVPADRTVRVHQSGRRGDQLPVFSHAGNQVPVPADRKARDVVITHYHVRVPGSPEAFVSIPGRALLLAHHYDIVGRDSLFGQLGHQFLQVLIRLVGGNDDVGGKVRFEMIWIVALLRVGQQFRPSVYLCVVAVQTAADVQHSARSAGAFPAVDPVLELPAERQVDIGRFGRNSVVPFVRVEHHLGIVADVGFVAFQEAERKVPDIYPVVPRIKVVECLFQERGNLRGPYLHVVQPLRDLGLFVLPPLVMGIEVDEVDDPGLYRPIVVLCKLRKILEIVPGQSAVHTHEAP